jgi:hypothetical protein
MNELPNDVLYEICTHLLPTELTGFSKVTQKLNTFVALQWNNLESLNNKLYLIRRYIKVVLASIQIDDALKTVDMKHCKPETQTIIKNKFLKMYDNILQVYEPHMIDMFRYDEITLLVKFTCSPAGSIILIKQAKSQQLILPILSESIQETISEVHQIIEDEKEYINYDGTLRDILAHDNDEDNAVLYDLK